MKNTNYCLFLVFMCLSCGSPPKPLLEALMSDRGGIVTKVYEEAEQYEVQILYTQIDRDAENKPSFTSHSFRVDNDAYFYPASTVKLPAAILALEKIKKLGIPGLDRNTSMLTDSAFSGQTTAYVDSSSANLLPSVGHYIKKILLISDNDAFNRLYEFLGQGPLNQQLKDKGYSDVKISHRLSVFLSAEQNQYTNPIRFVDGDELIYEQALIVNELPLPLSSPIMRGKGEIQGGNLIETPKDFSEKNAFPVRTQQQLLIDVLFPNSVMENGGFDLYPQDRKFLMKYMSMLPGESKSPLYPDSTYYDGYCKFFMYGDTKEHISPNIRIFNKVGNAYGYLTDNAYVVDFEQGIEFFLTATVYVNANQIFNDNVYEYDEIGYPFMADLGRMIYEYERSRKRKYKPDLSEFQFTYD